MRERTSEPQPLCDAADLRDGDGSVTFDVLEWGKPASAFAVRFDNRAVAYLNRCAHVPTELDWQPGQFWDTDRRYLICAVHGALYEPSHGTCVAGPCPGKRLVPIRVDERDGRICWYPDDRFQPVL